MLGVLMSAVWTLLYLFEYDSSLGEAWESSFTFLKYWYSFGIAFCLFLALGLLPDIDRAIKEKDLELKAIRDEVMLRSVASWINFLIAEGFFLLAVFGLDSGLNDQGNIVRDWHLWLGVGFYGVGFLSMRQGFCNSKESRKGKQRLEEAIEQRKPFRRFETMYS